MQRRPSKRQQHASKSLESTTLPIEGQQKSKTEEKKQKPKVTSYTPSRLFITVVCILPFLAAIVLFVRFYYESNNDDNVSRLSESLHDHEYVSTLTLDSDNRINENGRLRPEDHIYRGAVTQTLNWSITAGQRRPDGVDKRVYLINGMSLRAFKMTFILTFCYRSLSWTTGRSSLRRYSQHPRAQ